MKTNWLGRSLSTGPYLALCTTKAQFKVALKHMNVAEVVPFLGSAQANATTHHFDHPEGGTVCVVCLGSAEGRSGVSVAALLVHEAVHVWQAHRDSIGEKNPGREQEAYGIQHIAFQLMDEFARQQGLAAQ